MPRVGKAYYFDRSKGKWISRMMINGARHQIGSFTTEAEAEEAVKKYLAKIADKEMPPRRARQQDTTKEYTLNDALEFIETKLKNPDSTKGLYKRCLITFTRYAVDEMEEMEEGEQLTLDELADIYGEIDLVSILSDFERTKKVVEEEIKNSKTGEDIAIDTKKQYYSAFLALFTRVEGRLFLEKDTEKQFQMRMDFWNEESNKKRRLNLPKDYKVEDPSFTYEIMVKEFEDFIGSKKFTNTEQGRKDLRHAVVVGLYMLQRPRRVEDYWKLQYYSKEPTENEQKDRSILWLRKEDGTLKGTFYIDKFKIRKVVRKNKSKELLPRYIKDINPRLAELFALYIKHFGINDMSKLSAQDKREKKNYYTFFPDGRDPSVPYPTAGGYGKVVIAGMKKIFNNRKGLNTNAFRHNFNHWVAKNIEEFNDEKIKELVFDVGDANWRMPTNLTYRYANVNNLDKGVSEVIEQVKNQDYAKALYEGNAEEEGSVAGDVPQRNREEQLERELLTAIEEEGSELMEVSARDTMSVKELYSELGKVEAKLTMLMREKERLLKLLVA